GIRDFHVTGVQTCALPILAHRVSPANGGLAGCDRPIGEAETWMMRGSAWLGPGADVRRRERGSAISRGAGRHRVLHAVAEPGRQIGRASCRERVDGWGGGG